jgi:hypothetical protein
VIIADASVAEALLQSLDIVAAEVIVLVLNGDHRRRPLLQNVPGEQRALRCIDWIERNDPWTGLGIVESLCARSQEQVWGASAVEMFLGRDVGRSAERAGDGEHLVGFDQPAVCSSAFGGLKALSRETRLTRRPLIPPRSLTIWK